MPSEYNEDKYIKGKPMYQASLYFHLKTDQDRQAILQMFFEDWADGICNKKVTFSTTVSHSTSAHLYDEIIRVDFENKEDAVAMKLKGIPEEFQKYLKIVSL